MTTKIHQFLRAAQLGDAKTLCGRETTIHQTTHSEAEVTCRACLAVIRRLAVEKEEWEFKTRHDCFGHINTQSITFCDGSCRS